MANFDGQVMFALIAGLVLSWALAHLIARRFATKVLQLMQQPSASLESGGEVGSRRDAPAFVDLQRQNKLARLRLRIALAGVSALLALVIALVSQAAYVIDGSLSISRTLTLTIVYGWIVIPVLGLLERWSRGKILLWSLVYVAASGVVVMLNSNANQHLAAVLGWLVSEQLPMLVVVFALTGRKLRSVAPYLLLVLFPLMASSLVGLSALDVVLHQAVDTWVVDLVVMTNSFVVFGLFGILPWLLAFYPLKVFARYLAAAYRRKLFSETWYLLAGLWAIALLIQALVLSHSLGFSAYGLLLAWWVIPLSARFLEAWLRPQHTPPMLLLLRVFRGDDSMEALFDSVVEKWRYSGNTLLIEGKDLALRNLEPDELFSFMSGHLGDRFISDAAHLQSALKDIDLQADPDGRYRVNEFFCFDNTWKAVLLSLIAGCNRVLMDLRGYNEQRAGCSHELAVLANTPNLNRLVVLYDGATQREVAEKLLAAANLRSVWLDCDAIDQRQLQVRTLEALLQAA